MAIEETFFAMLSAAGTDAGTRIYPTVGPDNPTPPMIVYSAGGVPENTFAAAPPIENRTFQVDCYAQTFLAANTLAGQVQAAMQAWAVRNVMTLRTPTFEPEVKLHRITLEFSLWI